LIRRVKTAKLYRRFASSITVNVAVLNGCRLFITESSCFRRPGVIASNLAHRCFFFGSIAIADRTSVWISQNRASISNVVFQRTSISCTYVRAPASMHTNMCIFELWPVILLLHLQ
jgi:hypothetical protein